MRYIIAILFSIFALVANAKTVEVKMYLLMGNDQGKLMGTIKLADSKYGLLITPDLHGLPPGVHGFHVHQDPSCAEAGMAAGGHLDPKQTDKHLGPYTLGHLGDLPALTINKDGDDTLPVLAPRLTLSRVMNHALMIHEGGDNYSDNPKLGGGGARLVCGVVK